ncbi:MAG: LuxR family transcriptional regulator [Acetobacteraceae bacterium]|nr:LuxR family transcriptional regulator [Acetobacteraceae bacterium]
MSTSLYEEIAAGIPATAHDLNALADEALRALDEVSTSVALEGYLGGLCRRLGFDFFSYVLSDRMKLGELPAHRAMVATSYPAEWRLRYDRQSYHHSDPVVTVGSTLRRPFFWGSSDYLRQLTAPRRRLFEEARHFGIRSGFTVPVHGPSGECGLFSTSSADGMAHFEDAARNSYYLLQVVGPQVHAVIMERLLGRQKLHPVTLTEHERVCLGWTMRGKTAWEISQILGRSRPTIDFHLQKAIRKLDAANKFHAAFKALQAGLI